MDCQTSAVPRHPGRSAVAGFTLIELMIVIAIIAVLAGIAYASYQNSVVESRRKVATACLQEAAQFMERFYTTNLRYDQTTAGAAVAFPALGCRNDIAAFYTLSFNGNPTATTYAVRAVPIGVQASRDNTKCGTLGITQTGAKSASGAAGVAGCW